MAARTATISTHNGSSVSRGHNLRVKKIVEKEGHIDPDGIHETWVDEHPREAYERLFGDAVREYNKKQTRNDRKISDYYNKVREDEKLHNVYEMIVGVYGDGIEQKEEKEILKEFVNGWKERNPNLELIGAYYHADEEGKNGHVHCDYIPVAHGYKRGMSVRNGLARALGEQGIEQTTHEIIVRGETKTKLDTAQILWEKQENQALEDICNKHGIEVEHPQVGKGFTHVVTKIYKAKQELEDVYRQIGEKTQKAVEDAKSFYGDAEEIRRNGQEMIDEVERAKSRPCRPKRAGDGSEGLSGRSRAKERGNGVTGR